MYVHHKQQGEETIDIAANNQRRRQYPQHNNVALRDPTKCISIVFISPLLLLCLVFVAHMQTKAITRHL